VAKVNWKITGAGTVRLSLEPRFRPLAKADLKGGTGPRPQLSEIFSKVRFLMSCQIFLDSIIDLNTHIHHAMYIVFIHS